MKVTDKVQEAPAATEAPQVCVTLNCDTLDATLLIDKAPVPVLCKVTVLAALLVFCSVWSMVNEVVESDTTGTGAAAAEPAIEMVALPPLLAALVVRVKVALRDPVPVGENTTDTVHEPPAATLLAVEHVPLLMKSPALVPPSEIAEIVIAAVPELLTVTSCAVLC